MKYLYVDEAGKSQHEPMTFVAGIIVDADKEWRKVLQAINALFDEYVPPYLRKDFYFHAVDVYAGGRNVPGWAMQQRLSLLYAMMSMPRRMNMPLVIGAARRNPPSEPMLKFTSYEMDHLWAFHYMIAVADRYMRRETEPNEVLTVVCEDVERVRKGIRGMLKFIRENPIKIDLSDLNLPSHPSIITPHSGEVAVTRVVDTVHFVDKKDGPILQLADACAFGFRRYFANQQGGEDMLKVIVGSGIEDRIWAEKVHGEIYQWVPFKAPTSAEVIPFEQSPIFKSSTS